MFVTLNDTDKCTPSLVGGKAANIAKMRKMGLPAPGGFVCPTDLTWKVEEPKTLRAFEKALNSHIRHLASEEQKTWTLPYGEPLLVSVRSGAPVSMPGMMDTILNIGLNRENIKRFVESKQATEGFGWDCYRRLIQMFGISVKGIDSKKFSEIYDAAKIFYDDISDEQYKILADLYEEIYEQETGEQFPQDPQEQLLKAALAVYKSWFSDRAKQYREIEGIQDNLGTAVTVQPMIFGNLPRSATGVVFTHNPNTGEKGIYGDFLTSAQGEDVVAGTHKVTPINEIFEDKELTSAARELQAYMAKLLSTENDMLDVEFTIEDGKLYVLQYRIAKRSTRAGIRMIIDMTKDGEITSAKATDRLLEITEKNVPAKQVAVDSNNLSVLSKGLGVTEGEAVGEIAASHLAAQKCVDNKLPYVYVAYETSPDDTYYMKHAEGILTATGGRLSHAAVIARGWNKPCVVSCETLSILSDGILVNGSKLLNGSPIKINGETGEVFA